MLSTQIVMACLVLRTSVVRGAALQVVENDRERENQLRERIIAGHRQHQIGRGAFPRRQLKSAGLILFGFIVRSSRKATCQSSSSPGSAL
jgi:hypothetical protein